MTATVTLPASVGDCHYCRLPLYADAPRVDLTRDMRDVRIIDARRQAVQEPA